MHILYAHYQKLSRDLRSFCFCWIKSWAVSGSRMLSSSVCSSADQWIKCLRVRNVSGEQSVTTVHNYIPPVGTRHFERLMKWLVVSLQTTQLSLLDLGYYRYSDIIHLVSQRHDDSNYLLSDILSNFNYTLAYSTSMIPPRALKL